MTMMSVGQPPAINVFACAMIPRTMTSTPTEMTMMPKARWNTRSPVLPITLEIPPANSNYIQVSRVQPIMIASTTCSLKAL